MVEVVYNAVMIITERLAFGKGHLPTCPMFLTLQPLYVNLAIIYKDNLMHIRSKADIAQPLRSSSGENVFELVGASVPSGLAQRHSLAYIVLPSGGRSSLHYHQTSEESYYILSGHAQVKIDGAIGTLSPGQACLIKPPSRHEISNAGDEDLVFLAVCTPAWVPTDSFPVENA
jgi:mannose-6-phosphate isomerase-like protein (cupin superfamily)